MHTIIMTSSHRYRYTLTCVVEGHSEMDQNITSAGKMSMLYPCSHLYRYLSLPCCTTAHGEKLPSYRVVSSFSLHSTWSFCFSPYSSCSSLPPGDPAPRSNGLSIQPAALFPSLRANRFSRYTSAGYAPAQGNSDSWDIKTFSSWKFAQWLPPVQDQGSCGKKGGG